MAEWYLEGAARNHKGLLRAENEDNFYLNGKWMSLAAMEHGGRMMTESAAPFQLYAVCDGMGGEAAGELASHEAVQALGVLQARHLKGLSNLELMSAMSILSDQIFQLAPSAQEHSGTTITGILWDDGLLRVINIGDSRVYRLRGGMLTRLTTDHSEVQRMVDMGMMAPFQARLSPKRHLITQYLGLPSANPAFEPYLSAPLHVQVGDLYLLCSDGLIDMVEDEAIRRTLLRARDTTEAVDSLVQQALDNGGHDNVTALCVRIRAKGDMNYIARLKRGWHRVHERHE